MVTTARRWWPPFRPTERGGRSASWERRWACRRERSSGWRGAARGGIGTRVARTSPSRGERPRGVRALGVAGPARRRGARAAAPSVPALGRDDRRDPPVDRLLPDRPRGDGGPPDRPVGQGLLCGCRLSEDRPARPGDALSRGAFGGADRAHPGRANRSLPDPLRRRGHIRMHPECRHHRRLSDRESRADAVAAAHPPREPQGPHGPGRDRPPGPIQGGASTPISSAASGCGPTPTTEVPYEHPSLEPVLARDARHDHLPGPGARGRRSPSPASRRGRPRGCAGR